MPTSDIRVRIAPSPTGFMHIGTARAALFNLLFARKHGGTFILRIEDTDRARSEKRYEDDILDGLRWLGLQWDEFYRQSDRATMYETYIKKLLAAGKAFWCLHTPAELEAERTAQMQTKELPRHVCSYKNNPMTDGDGGSARVDGGVIRLAVDGSSSEKIVFNDMIRGPVEVDPRLLGDFSIAKSPTEPLFHIVNVVDDYESTISHVIRGEDHLSNTPKHILLQRAMGFTTPIYAHLPMILAPDKSKLSKRHGATSVTDYRKRGYLPEAIINYLGMLGFTPPGEREIMNLDELTKVFELAAVHKAGAVFDIKKLDWLNGEYIHALDTKRLATILTSFLPAEWGTPDPDYLLKVLPLARERMKRLADVEEFSYFFQEPQVTSELLQWKERTTNEIKNALSEVLVIIERVGVDDSGALRQELDALGTQLNDRGLVYWPLRIALTGAKASPDPVDIAGAIGVSKTTERIRGAHALL